MALRRKPVARTTSERSTRSEFRDTGWETVKQLASRDIDRLSWMLYLERATAIEDTGDVIVVEVASAESASLVARRFSSQIRNAFALVNRPRTVLRLRANLAGRQDEPDYYFRDIVPGATSTAA